MRPVATNVPPGSQWLFGDDLNKRIAQISSMNVLSQTFKSNNQQGRYNHSSASTYHQQHQSSKNGSVAEQQPILQELNVSTNTSCTFVAGKIKYYYNNWKNITNDRFILDIVKYGLKIDFKNKPQLANVPKILHNAEEKSIINLEINKLLKKGVITKCQKEEGDFIFNVFTRDKKDGTFRTILNLKYLNEFVEYKHFKMEYVEDVFKIIKKRMCGWLV